MEEIKNFRQLHSKTPGHPEYGLTPGVETTTGPLGQGIANAVGMAIAEKVLAAEFNRPGFDIVDHYSYVFLGDGCLMEGISHEACSLAGTLGLGKLIAFYDDNGISIDGRVEGWFTDDTPKRFEAYGWHVVPRVDGHNPAAVEAALSAARAVTDRPSLICCKTIIGKGAPNRAGTAKAHGEALGEAEGAAARKALGWNYPPFEIPAEIYAAWDARGKGAELEAAWNNKLTAYAAAEPELAAEFKRRIQGELPPLVRQVGAIVNRSTTRNHCHAQGLAERHRSARGTLPELIGGSADLAVNLTLWSNAKA
jgi:transketolase